MIDPRTLVVIVNYLLYTAQMMDTQAYIHNEGYTPGRPSAPYP